MMIHKPLINKILNYYIDKKVESYPYREELDFLDSIKDNDEFLPNTYPYEFSLDYLNPSDSVIIKDGKYYYFEFLGKRIYLPANWDENTLKYSARFIISEQDDRSPHHYDLIESKNSSVLDIGSSEGIFSIINYEDTNDYHLFDSEYWTYSTALSLNHSNVRFHNRWIDKDYTVDSIKFNKPVSDIKIDVEGSELVVLYGAINTIKKYKPKIQVATYHNLDDFRNIYYFLKSVGYRNIRASEGYLIFHQDYNLPPYFRNVLLKAY